MSLRSQVSVILIISGQSNCKITSKYTSNTFLTMLLALNKTQFTFEVRLSADEPWPGEKESYCNDKKNNCYGWVEAGQPEHPHK